MMLSTGLAPWTQFRRVEDGSPMIPAVLDGLVEAAALFLPCLDDMVTEIAVGEKLAHRKWQKSGISGAGWLFGIAQKYSVGYEAREFVISHDAIPLLPWSYGTKNRMKLFWDRERHSYLWHPLSACYLRISPESTGRISQLELTFLSLS